MRFYLGVIPEQATGWNQQSIECFWCILL